MYCRMLSYSRCSYTSNSKSIATQVVSQQMVRRVIADLLESCNSLYGIFTMHTGLSVFGADRLGN
jgi:hypothetical protein